ncbi:Peptidyl-prolyl cis-trans isomerase-like 2 [Dinothrombium tinctorium]|uniref:RING-type E3 ubiquitin-protein ligase PPIL2 n=1 Tax=Dinothrombium tinctorium TaxID=1965070 RepID=A0A3S3RPB9_9ACAR|nr:Peptidyl-prolyl cis-trans isomerase-like 2 [Dinothrombium tinctorium]
MGKRQHQKDKLYLTCTEWKSFYGGRRVDATLREELSKKFRRLPFDHCSLSLQPFRDPYCNEDGYIFDLSNIVPFLKKFAVDPISGKRLEAKNLIKLNFSKTEDGFYQCPILMKTFNENSHIVAIKSTGNVFSHEAVEQLNLKSKNFRDLLTDEPFTKKDIIVIQEPMDAEKRNAATFYHIINKLKWNEEEEEEKESASQKLKSMDHITKQTLEELNKISGESAKSVTTEKSSLSATSKPDKFNTATYSTGKAAASITSTAMNVETKVEPAMLSDDTVRYSRVKGKGYVQLQTNYGPLNFELYCADTPKTCDNFIQLCKRNYYDGTKFHRLIKNFILQGGDPTGTGRGGESAWKEPFKDEFKSYLVHQGRGVLSMANSGKDANTSQFFITFRSCRHLDKKHTIFGKLVGGLETLDKIEQIETDEKDKPVKEVKIMKAVVFIDPFQQVDDYLAEERLKLRKEAEQKERKEETNNALEKQKLREGVGAFVDLSHLHDDDGDVQNVVIVGNGVVGKSSLIQRFCKGVFTSEYKKTIGVDFLEKTVKVGVHEIRLMLWDTAGQEEFGALTKAYYRGAQACVLAFSTTDRESFLSIEAWKKKVEYECGSIPMVLVQNKIDLMANSVVSYDEVESLSRYLQIKLYRTSVKEMLNVKEVFQFLAECYIDSLTETEEELVPSLSASGLKSALVRPANLTTSKI